MVRPDLQTVVAGIGDKVDDFPKAFEALVERTNQALVPELTRAVCARRVGRIVVIVARIDAKVRVWDRGVARVQRHPSVRVRWRDDQEERNEEAGLNVDANRVAAEDIGAWLMGFTWIYHIWVTPPGANKPIEVAILRRCHLNEPLAANCEWGAHPVSGSCMLGSGVLAGVTASWGFAGAIGGQRWAVGLPGVWAAGRGRAAHPVRLKPCAAADRRRHAGCRAGPNALGVLRQCRRRQDCPFALDRHLNHSLEAVQLVGIRSNLQAVVSLGQHEGCHLGSTDEHR